MARIPVTSNRPAKNVRNGPSIWQQRLFTLLRETRWAVLLIVTVWLSLVLFTWNSSDPGWFSSGDGSPIHNKGGYVGAYVADILYFHFGYSAWLIVLFLVYQLGVGFQRITSMVMPNKAIKEPLPRIPWGLAVGFVLLLMGSMGFESMQTHYGSGLPAGPGGQLGLLLSHVLVLYLGAAVAVIILLVAMCVGASWLFDFSWLNVAERVGGWVEKGYFYLVGLKHRFDDRQAGRLSIAQRLESMTSKRLKSKVLPTAPKEPVVAERKEPSLPPIVTAARQYKNPIFEELEPEPEPVIVSEPEPEPFIEPEPEVLSTHPIQTQTQATVVKAVKAPSEVGLPTLDLLDQAEDLGEFISADTLEFTSRLIEKKLSDFGVNVTVEEALSGPVITRYEIEPATGVKGVQIVNLSKDLARSLSLVDIRVVETIPGKNLMGLELPNPKRQVVRLEEIIGSVDFDEAESLLTVALGKDIAGEAVVADLARMPHLLVAGTTGSGKSVGINAMILSLLYKATPDEVRLILIDPKMLEMSVYEDIPHLLAPVVTDMSEAANALTWCVNEMDRRYNLMSKMGVRNLAGFNSKIDEAAAKGESLPNPFSLTPDAPEPLEKLPFIVVIIDELADLMMVAGKKIEELIARLAQKARAAGIHLILATQRPSVDVITGLIKANIPTRISFQVSSRVDSRTVLDQAGAETLLGMGDMLYLPPGTSVPVRVHGAFVADDEVHRVVEYLKAQGEPDYIEGLLEGGAPGETGDGVNPVTGMADAEADPLYDAAVALVLESKRASASWVQRNLSVGYNRAARLVEEMERNGILSPMGSNGRREILVPTNTAEEVN